ATFYPASSSRSTSASRSSSSRWLSNCFLRLQSSTGSSIVMRVRSAVSFLRGAIAMKLESIAPPDRLKSLGVRMKGLIQIIVAGIITVILPGVHPAQAQIYNLMPQPAKLEPGSGRLVIDGRFRVALDGYREPRLEAATARLLQRLSLETGIPFRNGLEIEPGKATLVLHCDHGGEAVQSVREDESYQLDVTPQQARLSAPTPVGVLRGMETFLQLVELDAQGFSAPAVRIADHPRFPWRGLMMDVSRHWIPEEVVKRNLDAMAAVKLNVLHFHLTDNQGFRIESRTYPKL